jgi:hypothetical protein
MAMLARLGVVLGLDSAEFQKGLAEANRQLDSFVSKAQSAIPGVTAAFAAMTYKALAYADAIADTAKANDVAIESILALSEGLRQNGGEAANATKMLATFTQKVDEAASGSSKKLQDDFAKLGVSLRDIANLDMESLFDKSLQSLAKMQDPISRNALAMELFGKAAKGVDFVGLANGTDEARQKFVEYAKAVKMAGDLHDELEQKTNDMVMQFTNAVIPTLNELFDSFNKNTKGAFGFMDAVGEVVKVLAVLARYTATTFSVIAEDIRWLGESASLILTGQFDKLSEAYQRSKKMQDDLVAGDERFAKRVIEGQRTESESWADWREGRAGLMAGGAQRKVTKAKDPAAAKLAKEIAEAELKLAEYNLNVQKEAQEYYNQALLSDYNQTEELKKQKALLDIQLESIKEKADQVLRAAEQQNQFTNLSKLETDQLRIQLDYENSIADAKVRYGKAAAEAAIRDKDGTAGMLAAAEAQYASDLRVAEGLRYRQQAAFEYSQTYAAGVDRVVKSMKDSVLSNADLMEKSLTTVFDSMSNAIDTFVKTGKISFRSLVGDMIKELLRLQLKAQATSIFQYLLKGIGSIFSGPSFSSTTPEVSTTDIGTTTFFGPPRATGGYIDRPSIVGENGPELFVPNRAGTIIPNGQMSGMMGGPQIVYNGPYIANMSTIDSKSFEERIYQSSKAVWAAQQYANKSIAQAGGRS